MTLPTRPQVEALIRATAPALGLDADLSIRQCAAESGFRADAVSSCGARGLFQLMPATAKELGVDLSRWQSNVYGGLKYMAWLVAHYGGDAAKAYAAYNWGVGRLDKLLAREPDGWREHLPAETRGYLKKIIEV